VLLAGGTRERGSPLAIAITAPFPGAAIEPVSSLHSVPRAAFGVAMLTLLRVPFLDGDAPLAHAGSGLWPGRLAKRPRVRVGAGFSVTGYKLRERLAVPVAETRDVKPQSLRARRRGPGEPLY